MPTRNEAVRFPAQVDEIIEQRQAMAPRPPITQLSVVASISHGRTCKYVQVGTFAPPALSLSTSRQEDLKVSHLGRWRSRGAEHDEAMYERYRVPAL